MLIVPADSSYSQGRRPLITAFLILINCLVFMAVQGSDRGEREKAIRFYAESGLFEMEFKSYLAHLNRRGDGVKAAEILQTAQSSPQELFNRLMKEKEFRQGWRDGSLVWPSDEHYEKWRTLRWKYDDLMADIAGNSLAFDASKPGIGGAFTHMFMHGGWDHLLGNMVVLGLVGALVEYALGAVTYVFFYLLSGLAAVAAFYLANFKSGGSVLGASGAVSGVMAMFAVLYGMRKVRFFYTLGFYFDFIRLPALVLLPYWLGWEIIQYFLKRDAGAVAYEAHAGGLMAGAALAWFFGRQGVVEEKKQEVLDKPATVSRREQDLQMGMSLMARLQFDRARGLFERLYAEQPTDLRPLLQLYRIAKTDPASEAFHRYARSLLQSRTGEADRIFDDYWKAAQPQPQLEVPQMMVLLNRYAASVQLNRVDLLVAALQKSGCRDRAVGITLDSLAGRVDADRARVYRAIAVKHFSG